MRFIQVTIAVVCTVAFSGTTSAGSAWNPSNAIAEAKETFVKNGYSPITVADGSGRLYHGEKETEQSVIFCALEDADANLRFYKVKSIDAAEVRSFVTKYNTEMMRLLAEKKGCLR